MLISDYFAETLVKEGIDRVYLYPGGTIAPLLTACLKKKIQIEIFKNEQGAAYAALAHARLTGMPQVVMVTSGPGVTNTISPIADAFYDSTPLIVVTGQVGTNDLLSRTSVRQRGFQEVPTTKLTECISKRTTCLINLELAFKEIPLAFKISKEGRFGPVILDFPMNIQRLDCEIKKVEFPPAKIVSESKQIESDIKKIIRLGCNSQKPVILLGQGVINSGIYDEINILKNLFDAVVVTSFLGISSFDTNDNSYAGYIGHTGHLSANQAVHECDFLLVLGSRLDVRQTGTLVESFVPKGIVVSVNNDLTELDNPRVDIDWKINLDLKKFCNLVKQNANLQTSFSDKNWKKKIYHLKNSQIEDMPSNKSSYIQPKEVMKKLFNIIILQKTVVVTGVGCHQHWAARHLPFKPKNNLFLSSGGHGTMGYDLPSAIGASMTLNNFRVFCIVGDGSLLMNIQELASLSERNLDVKIILMNNNRLGIVSQFQKITWGEDPSTGYFNTPDFVSIANGFSIKAKKITNPSEINTGIDWINSFTGPGLLEIVIDKDSDVVPMLMSEQPMNSMWMGRGERE